MPDGTYFESILHRSVRKKTMKRPETKIVREKSGIWRKTE